MQSKLTKQMVMTAAILALTLVFQNLRLLPIDANVSAYLIGSLVNLCLILSVGLVGLWSGLTISVAAPLVALLQGYAKLQLLPYIIGGNIVLVLLYSLIAVSDWRKSGEMRILPWGIAGVLAAGVKFAVIAVGTALMISTQKGAPFSVTLSVGAAQQVQQIVTALIALLLAYPVLPRVKIAAKL